MKRFLTSVFIGAVAIIGLVTFNQVVNANSKVFHHNVAVDNGDSCRTPAEEKGILLATEGNEWVKVWDAPGDIEKIKVGMRLMLGYKADDVNALIPYDKIELYLFKDHPNQYFAAVYLKDCKVSEFFIPFDDYDTLLKTGGITEPKVSNGAPAPANTTPPTATRPKQAKSTLFIMTREVQLA